MKVSPPTICRMALAAIFLAAGAAKLAHPAAFFSDLLSYRVALPEFALRLTAVLLPWLEVLCGISLLGNVWPETIRPLVALQCAAFVAMLGQAVARGLDLNCGCFGAGAEGWFERPAVALARALLLFAAALWLAMERKEKGESALRVSS